MINVVTTMSIETVTEPKHPGKTKPSPPAGMTEFQEIMKKKFENDEERAKARVADSKERNEIERERLQLEKAREDNRVRLEFVKAASSSTLLSEDVKEKMNKWVGDLFS